MDEGDEGVISIAPPDGVATPDELERLLSPGARRVDIGQGPDVSWVFLRDPGATSSARFAVGPRGLTVVM